MWEWLAHGYQTRIVDTGREPLFLLLVGLLGSFLFIRFSVRMIRRGVSWWPGNVQPGGLHIHHVVFGLAGMLAGGIGSFALRGEARVGHDLLALLFGIGCGLVLDEFALVLHLEDVYWREEGRQSVDAVILAVTVIGLLLLGVTPLGGFTGSLLTRTVAIGVLLALVVLSLLKGKLWTGLFGLFLVVPAFFGAIRLARPASPWARWRYYSRPRRLARAERREQRVHGRLDAARRKVYNAVAGAPHLESPRPAPPKRPAPPRVSLADLPPTRAERLLRPLAEPCAVAVVWYLRLAAALDVLTGLIAPFRERIYRADSGDLFTPFLVTAGFTAALVASLLAVMLRRRKRAAWLITFTLAGLNALVYWGALLVLPDARQHVVNWVSAGVTTAVAVALVIARTVCQVRGERGNIPLGLGWFVLGGVLAAGLGTVLVHGTDTEPAASWTDCLRYALLRVFTLSTLFELPDITVPGWTDLLINVLSVALLLQVLRAFFRSPRGRARLGPEDEDRLRGLLARFGADDSLGYFALHRDKAVAWSPGQEAAVTYRVINGVALASGDPVGDPAAWPAAIGAWLHTARSHGWVPAVTGASERAAGLFERAGMRVLAFGDEAVTAVADADLTAPEARPLREARDELLAAGYSVTVRRHREVAREEMDGLVHLADAWRNGAVDRGFTMTLGRMGDPADGACVIVECRDPNDRTCALLDLVPWDGGAGLSLDLMRRERESPDSVFALMLTELLLRARAGADPVADVERIALNFTVFHAPVTYGQGLGTGFVFRVHRLIVRLLSPRRGLEGVHRDNAGLRPHWQPRFMLYERPTELPRIAVANAGVEGVLTARRMRRFSPAPPAGQRG
ncbi:phosphatidylglycerol lysyltransferase domain-containing protein [Streptomyces sp. PTM05]|uniref:Phosphatidylglycerol lysyltransferase domain-containing protein n=1 Tax=Streptantibioticus parmotrematis TaxID=2873249 RepID=A0ABS7QXH1_9ACTN|nr:phosphatidylglycerol lysyltransferase domain-containing protein [Streptantibioticus parmotrematis]MBY8887902.1 phosphatidylglycerol lysyltransferase domain-containing protein [Streptantibioticus parmotrematis]